MTQVNQQPAAAPVQQNQQVKRFEEGTVESVLSKIESFKSDGKLQLPPSYSPENAVRSAWLMIQQAKDISGRPALEVCSSASIANSLLDMVLQGLSPVKKQCYFIVMGNQLTMMKSYFGTIAISKRVAGVKEAIGIPIYEGDVFKYTIDLKSGIKIVTEHDQQLENIDINKLKGAYAIITYDDGHIEYDIMTMAQIRTSWEMGNAKGKSKAHINFPDQMACRTVINRALKIPVNSSNDNDLFDEDMDIRGKQVEESVKLEIKENSNGAGEGQEIGFEDEVGAQAPEAESAPAVEQEPVVESGKQIKAPF